MTGEVVKVEKLIQLLEEFDPEAEVRVAANGRRERSIVDVDVRDDSAEDRAVVYVIEGGRV